MEDEKHGSSSAVPASSRIRFGPYELDLRSAELRKNEVRIRLQDQPFQLLLALLERPGELVMREEIRKKLWPDDTVVEFDHGINAAVKRLRDALCDSVENPRYIETLARKGYRFLAEVEAPASQSEVLGPAIEPVAIPAEKTTEPVPLFLEAPPAMVELAHNTASRVTPVTGNTNLLTASRIAEISSASATPALKLGIRNVSVVAIGIAAVAALTVFGVRFWHKAIPHQPRLIQLTSGTGLTMDPAVSPDGKLLAYVSDRADGRNLNIWIQQLTPAGTAVQLTHLDSDTTRPSFSPDGSRIVFHSTADGGAIYAIPTIGGEPARLAAGGRNPRFSPDGKWIAFWTGVPNTTVLTGGEGGDLYVLSATGGQPHRLGASLHYAGNPVWSPDSKRLLAFCPDASDGFLWCVIPMNGVPSSRASVFDSLKQQGFTIGNDRVPRVSQWLPGYILFSAVYGDALNVWRMPVSDEGLSLGPAERLTSGTTLETSPLRTPNGNLIFASLNLVQSIWSIPLDADRAKVMGGLKKLTDGTAEAQSSISQDGRKLVFVVKKNLHPNSELLTPEQPSTFEVRLKDLSTGKEASIPDANHQELHPQISRDGTQILVSADDRIQIFGIGPQLPRMLVETEKGGKLWDWSSDHKRILFGKYPHPNIYEYVLSTRQDSLFLPGDGLFQAKFSPDGRAVVMVACSESIGCQLFVVPLKNGGAAEKDRWIAIDHPSRWDDKPRWSPDGNLIYFISDRDGQFCLWAQRLENVTKRPVDTPFPIYHFHDSRLAMDNVGTNSLEIGIARDKIVMDLGELTGNIWSLRR